MPINEIVKFPHATRYLKDTGFSLDEALKFTELELKKQKAGEK